MHIGTNVSISVLFNIVCRIKIFCPITFPTKAFYANIIRYFHALILLYNFYSFIIIPYMNSTLPSFCHLVFL